VQSDRGLDKVEARNPAHSELSPSLADSDPSGGKAAPAKELGTHTRMFSLHSQILTTFTDGKGKKAAKKPDAGKARQKSQPNNKGKRKALADGDGSDAVEDANDKKTAKPTKKRAQKSQTTTAKESHPTDPENDNDTDDAAVPKKKKMRKLNVNIFGSSKADSLDWANQFNMVSSHIAVRILSYDCIC
jgi:hypothetical protein